MGKTVYLRGLGDLYITGQIQDTPSLIIDQSESVTPYAAIATGAVSLSQIQLLQGTYSIKVVAAAPADGAKFTPTGSPVDYSAYEDTLFLANIYSPAGAIVDIVFAEGANSETFQYTLVAGWNRVLLDLSSPDSQVGTTDWSALDDIDMTLDTAETYYIDGLFFIANLNDAKRTENIRLGCTNEIALAADDESIELKCSRGEITETDIISSAVTLSSVIKDLDPDGLKVISGGNVTTDSITKLVEDEIQTVASNTITLVNAATLKTGNGFGVWVYKTETNEMLQPSPDIGVIPTGYFYVNPTTGVLTFNPADEGVQMTIFYNATVSDGLTLEIPTSRDFQEFTMQFRIKGSNNRNALVYIPKLKSSSFGFTPELEDYWSVPFEANVLADTVSGNYYEFHVSYE